VAFTLMLPGATVQPGGGALVRAASKTTGRRDNGQQDNGLRDLETAHRTLSMNIEKRRGGGAALTLTRENQSPFCMT
jgi:hypothetical protein